MQASGAVVTLTAMRAGVIAAMMVAAIVPAPATQAAPPPEERGGGRLCKAIKVNGAGGQVRSIVEYDSSWAATHVRRLGRNGAFWITVHGDIGCDRLRGQLASVLLARDELVALKRLGWAVSRVDRMRVDGVPVHRVSATKRGSRISYVRPGGRPEVDGSIYRAGQMLTFDRSRTTCTSAFVLRLRGDGSLVGLSAGHCSAGPAYAPPQYPGGPPIYVTDTVSRVRGKASTPLGPVRFNANLREPGPDGLVFGLGNVPFAAQEIDRGARSPHRVTGMLPLQDQREGRVVCFTGTVSGVDRCGRIDGASTWFGRRVICARARGTLSRDGDSGGAVYTRPVAGRVRAVGIVTRSSVGGRLRDMCYTPIQYVLEALYAELPTGVFPLS
jgi:hypothetical protein